MKVLQILILLSISISINAQNWIVTAAKDIPLRGKIDLTPTQSIIAEVNDAAIKEILWSAPHESRIHARNSTAKLTLMMPDQRLVTFGIVSYDMMESKLADKFSEIRTFKGVAINDPHTRVRIDYTVHGLRAVIRSLDGMVYIDHFQRNDKNHKIIYWKKDYKSDEHFTCNVHDTKEREEEYGAEERYRQGSCKFYTLRLANAVTAEYAAFHGATSSANEALVQSAVVTTINRVNEVYEADFGFRVILVDDNEQLYYYDAASDPYTNSSGSTMLGENITNVDNVIGSANYDIGHVFSTGGGGVAYLSSVCASNKAGGVTGQGSPVGDPFDIDYVAHEMGHQFGANHTQNNSCNRVNATAMEPGSASTIMGYAGICSPNVQNNSDPHFHAISLQEIMNDASTFSCATEITNFGNTDPEVSTASGSYNIPISTPFVLSAIASDADGDPLTYCWEQMDNEIATMPPQSTNTGGPAFRSLDPTSSPDRYFPDLNQILTNGTDQWEVLPSVTRDMNFRVTVRDFHDGPGDTDGACTSEADVEVAVNASSGPFVVTSHATADTWLFGQSVPITWDVANTNVAPVSCTEVEVFFSALGDFTDASLLSTVANTGTANITAPSVITTTGRYMIKAKDNIFFDVNKGDITIESSTPTFLLSADPNSQTICLGQNASFVINSTSILGFNEKINLTATNLPNGATYAIAQSPILPGESTNLLVNNLTNVGTYVFQVEGQAGTEFKSIDVTLVVASLPATAALTSPADQAEDQEYQPTLQWMASEFATDYTYELYQDNSLVESGSVNTTQVQVSQVLSSGTSYEWRVRAENNCGLAAWTDMYTFTTKSCYIYAASDLPINISSSGQVTINSILPIADRGTITDINVLNLSGTHTYMSDLNFTLTAPDGTAIEIWDQPCGSQNNFDINFDDEAANSDWPCPPTDAMTYQPSNDLSAFDNKAMLGDWNLQVFDDANQDGGQLQSWALEICPTDYCGLSVNNNNDSGLGSLDNALSCAEDGDIIFISSAVAGQQIIYDASLIIDKNISIVSESNDVELVFTSGALQVLTGKELSLQNFIVKKNGAAIIQNSGTLNLNNMILSSDTDSFVTSSSNAVLNVSGTTTMKVE